MSTDIPQQPGSTEAPASTSLTSRLLNVFIAPGEVFAEVKTSRPCYQNWLVPALIFMLASWCGAAIMFSQDSIRHQMEEVQEVAMQKQFQKQIDSGKMTQAQANQTKAMASKFGAVGHIIGAVIVPFFVAGLTPFWGGFVIWLGSVIFKRRIDYMKAVEGAGLPLMIMAVGALVKGLLAAATGNAFASLGPALLMKNFDPTNPIHNTLMVVDVFMLWSLALRGMGLAKLSGVSLVKGMVWVFGVWLTITGSIVGIGLALQKIVAAATGQN